MRSVLVTVLLIIVVVGLYTVLFGGEQGLMKEIERREAAIAERIIQLNP